MSRVMKSVLSSEEYLARERRAEWRSEFYRGEMFAMAGASWEHTLIKDNLARENVKKLIPIAEETKVVIALENVWNNFCVKPSIFKWLVASFQSPWVKAYFDVGNHVKYLTPPETWIREFGPLLGQVHIKDFRLNPDNHGGRFVHPRDGRVNWPGVRQALDDVGYHGWLTIEDGGIPCPEFNKRLDLIIAGK